MTINYKKIAADAVIIGSVVLGVIAVLVNVSHGINLPAPYVAWLVTASGVIGAIVNALKPIAAATAAKVMRSLKLK